MRLLFILFIACFSIGVFAQSKAKKLGKVEISYSGAKLSLKAKKNGALKLNVPRAMQARLVDKGVVNYGDFGATSGDDAGDENAIAATHAFANEHDLPVRATDGAIYNLSGKRRTAIIMTDTDFGTAQFIIDDRAVEDLQAPLFIVQSRLEPFPLKGVTTLKRGQRKIRANLPGPCLITAENDAIKRYIRFGRNQNKGKRQTDIFVVNRRGKIDQNAPIIWDFDRISKLTARPIDEEPLYVRGGIFTTIANQVSSRFKYYARDIQIFRSTVILDGIEHRVTGEGEIGAPYRGFLNVRDCAYVTIKNALLTGHKTYRKIGSAGKSVPMGSYDFSAARALNVALINCRQTNSIHDRKYWGIMASNYCKNLSYDGCVLSRFDAHMGVVNVVIRDSELGHMGIQAIGGGTLLLENTTVHARSLINLRPDYGSTWRGDIIVKNCTLIPPGGINAKTAVITGRNPGSHNFGYVCYLPEEVVIDGLEIRDKSPGQKAGIQPTVFASFQSVAVKKKPVAYPVVRPRKVKLSNVSVSGGSPLRVSNNQALFSDVRVRRR